MIETPFYDLVVKDLRGNLEQRKKMLRRAAGDRDYQRTVWAMCARDPLFYINTLVFTYDPRKPQQALPFITYPFQDEAILEILDCIKSGRDLVIEKSRDMGASWMVLLAFEWRWHFHRLNTFLVVSRKEDLVDKSDDPDSLFWKLDFILANQPGWMVPKIKRSSLHLKNIDMQSTIDGDSTTGDIGVGGRRTAIFADEFARVKEGKKVLDATADTSKCRIFGSTHLGTGGAFYELTQDKKIRRLRLHWTKHPEKAAGLYFTGEHVKGYADPEWNGKKPRSPWYDAECERRKSKADIAENIDMDPVGSGYAYFDAEMLDRLQEQVVRPPYIVGELEYDRITGNPIKFRVAPEGRIRLWMTLDGDDKPLRLRKGYVGGTDISAGTGASNSAAAFADPISKEVVLDVADPNMRPEEWAVLMVALCRWLRGHDEEPALLAWEANGPGHPFGRKVLDLGHRKIYYQKDEKNVTRKISDIPGWWNTALEIRELFFGQLRSAMANGEFLYRSIEVLQECREYVYGPGGKVMHRSAIDEDDPSGAREQHGDRVIGAGVLWQAIRHEFGTAKEAAPLPAVVAVNSFLARRQRRGSREEARSW